MTRLARQLPLYTFVVVLLLAVLAYGTARRLTARAATASPATIETALPDGQGEMWMHVADSDKDVGPGEAESVLATHPGP